MKRVVWLAATLLTLALILVGLAALVVTTHPVEIDVTPFKDRIADALFSRTGLLISADGVVRLRVGSRLGVEAEGLQIRNPALPDAGDLAEAERAALEVETLPLLSARFEPTLLHLERAEIKLVRDSSGSWNWQPALADRDGRGERVSEASTLFPDALHVVGKNVDVAYKDASAGTVFEALLASVNLAPTEAGLRIDLDGSVDGYPLQLIGTTATLSQLIEDNKSVPLDLKGNLLGLKVTAQGTLANPRAGAQVSARLRLEGKSMAGLRPWVGEAIAAKGPVKAKLDLKGGGKLYELSSFHLAIGEGRFDGTLKLDQSGKKPSLDLELGIEEVDLTPLFEDKNARSGGRGSGTKRASTDLFPDEPLSLAWMDAVNLKARIRLRNLITPYTSMQSIDMDADLTAGHLSIKGTGTDPGRRPELFELELNSGLQPPVASLRYKANKLSLESLLAGIQARGMIRGEVDVSLDLQTSGNSRNRMASSLSGKLLFLVEQARADLRQLDRLTPGVVNLFGQLARPDAKSATLNCGLAAFDFQGGRTRVNVLVDTPDSTVVAQGDLDLGAETLNVRVTPDAKGVNLKVAAPVVIHGSLASPDFTVEKGHLLVSLTELVSKIAVPQLLLVDAFGDAVAENSCVKIASGTVDLGGEGPLEVLTQPVDTVVKGAGAVVNGTGTAVKEVGGAVVKGAGALIKGVGGAVGGVLGGARSQGAAGSRKNRPQEQGNSFLDE
jgi:uncharacterized protein involved in outer membrane biogenesis